MKKGLAIYCLDSAKGVQKFWISVQEKLLPKLIQIVLGKCSKVQFTCRTTMCLEDGTSTAKREVTILSDAYPTSVGMFDVYSLISSVVDNIREPTSGLYTQDEVAEMVYKSDGNGHFVVLMTVHALAKHIRKTIRNIHFSEVKY